MHSLAWLAHQLSQHGQTEFYLERMQPDWLPESILGNRYHRALLRLTFGIEIFVSAAIFAWLRGGWVNGIAGVGAGLLGLLGSGAGNHILGWMAPGLGGGLEGGGSLGILLMLVSVLVKLLMQRAPLPSVSRYIVWHGLRQGLRSGLLIATLVGLFSGGIFSFSGGVVYGLSRGVVYGLFSGLVIGLMMGLVAGLSTEEQRPLRAEQHITDRLSLFDRLLSYASQLGLFAEEIGTNGIKALGNYPQAFTHIALINSAHNLKKAEMRQAEHHTDPVIAAIKLQGNHDQVGM